MWLREKEADTAKRALAMTKRRLDQAEEVIDTFMENPTEDPTTLAGKDCQIAKLEAEIRELNLTNPLVNEAVMNHLKNLDKENWELKL